VTECQEKRFGVRTVPIYRRQVVFVKRRNHSPSPFYALLSSPNPKNA
jgi:hypothetical protein